MIIEVKSMPAVTNLIFLIVVTIFTVLGTCPSNAGEVVGQKHKSEWQGLLIDGSAISETDLNRIIASHEAWVKEVWTAYSSGPKTRRYLNLIIQKMDQESFNKAYKIKRADFSGANLRGADLRLRDLRLAKFCDADMEGIHLEGANLEYASMVGAKLYKADLRNTKFIALDASRANFCEADCNGAVFTQAKLVNANFYNCRLQNTQFYDSDLTGASFAMANMDGVVFDIDPKALPSPLFISTAQNLDKLTYNHSPVGLAGLRNTFIAYGLRQSERELTYAIKSNEIIKDNDVLNFIPQLLFGVTCGWGLYPIQPVLYLLYLIIPFALIYLVSLYVKGGGCIWRSWQPDRIRLDEGTDTPESIKSLTWKYKLAYSFYFSVLSAFRFGWRDLNVGTWMSHMQPREYLLRATGWVRLVSGIQSVISLYLVALAVLTYFGRPFE
ncbi:MAG: pentapeptide repeat-containing protein [Pseudomonadota bacterium]